MGFWRHDSGSGVRWVPRNVSCFSLLPHPSHCPHQAQYTNQPTIHECIILGEVSEISPEFSVTSGRLNFVLLGDKYRLCFGKFFPLFFVFWWLWKVGSELRVQEGTLPGLWLVVSLLWSHSPPLITSGKALGWQRGFSAGLKLSLHRWLLKWDSSGHRWVDQALSEGQLWELCLVGFFVLFLFTITRESFGKENLLGEKMTTYLEISWKHDEYTKWEEHIN